MLYEMLKKSDIREIMKYGKSKGALLLNLLLSASCKSCKMNNFFVFDSVEDFRKIEERLPKTVILRADAKLGETPTLGVRGTATNKEKVVEYIEKVKVNNPKGVVLCIDTDVENQNKSKSIEGSFNVHFEWGQYVLIDYLGAGFDVGGITKGEDRHEVWRIDWEELLFITPNKMNTCREYIISKEQYVESQMRKIQAIMRQKKCSEEEARKAVPEKYKPMSLTIKEKLLNEIIFEIYSKKQECQRLGLKSSFGIQGMIRGGELFPIEINSPLERSIAKGFLENKSDDR